MHAMCLYKEFDHMHRVSTIIVCALFCLLGKDKNSFVLCMLILKPDQEKILALLAAWSFDRKPTAECGNFSIENVISITKKQALKAV